MSFTPLANSFSWISCFIQEIYLVEVPSSVNKNKLPSDWTKTGGTKVTHPIYHVITLV